MGTSAETSGELASGPRLPARYQLRRHIATGGMASVWCAEDLVLGRSVAVKVLSDGFVDDAVAVQRFQREARAAARVSGHPHVVTIFDVGDIEPSDDGLSDGDSPVARAFIVMEFLAGGTVADAIRVGAVRRPEAIRWLQQAASALDHAHQRGIVHRDIKPANFLLDNERVLHVADFGIARLQSEDTITSSGELFGTAAYLAPEQALGREATSATDRYSLAVAAFELLTGERPFTAAHFAAQARQHIEDDPPSASERNRDLPPAVDHVLTKGMAKPPGDRFETAGAFVTALETALDDDATEQTRLQPVRPAAAAMPVPVPVRRPGSLPPRGRAGADRSRPTAGRSRSGADRPRRGADRSRSPAGRSRAPAAGRGAGPAAATSTTQRRSRRMLAFAALLVAVLGVVLVGLLSQSGSGTPRRTAAHGARQLAAGTPRSRRHRQAGTAPAATSASTSATTPASTTTSSAATSPAAPASASTPVALQAQGHQDLQSGNYPAAISALQRAVSTADPSSLTYAYALYDLGDALLRSGNPSAAIPVLQKRLQIPNQTAVVQQTLNQAKQAAGQSTPAPPAPSGTAQPGAGATGGAALPPGHAKHDGHGNGNGNGNGD